MSNNTNGEWYGLSADGKRVMMSGKNMADWAFSRNLQFSVGWSNAYKMPDGTRLVRGPHLVKSAREKGWDDLAEQLLAFGFTETEEADQPTA